MKISFKVKCLIYILLSFVILFYIAFKKKGIIDYYKLNNKFQELLKENNHLKKENEKLIETINKLKTDKEYIEKIAREKYNMVGKGEILIKINNKGGKK